MLNGIPTSSIISINQFSPLNQIYGFNLSQRRPQDAEERTVIALQNYTPLGDNGLPLEIDQKYVLVNTSQSGLWTLKNSRGWVAWNVHPSLFSLFIFILWMNTSSWWIHIFLDREKGFAPSHYVAKTSGDNFERFGWISFYSLCFISLIICKRVQCQFVFSQMVQ